MLQIIHVCYEMLKHFSTNKLALKVKTKWLHQMCVGEKLTVLKLAWHDSSKFNRYNIHLSLCLFANRQHKITAIRTPNPANGCELGDFYQLIERIKRLIHGSLFFAAPVYGGTPGIGFWGYPMFFWPPYQSPWLLLYGAWNKWNGEVHPPFAP